MKCLVSSSLPRRWEPIRMSALWTDVGISSRVSWTRWVPTCVGMTKNRGIAPEKIYGCTGNEARDSFWQVTSHSRTSRGAHGVFLLVPSQQSVVTPRALACASRSLATGSLANGYPAQRASSCSHLACSSKVLLLPIDQNAFALFGPALFVRFRERIQVARHRRIVVHPFAQ